MNRRAVIYILTIELIVVAMAASVFVASSHRGQACETAAVGCGTSVPVNLSMSIGWFAGAALIVTMCVAIGVKLLRKAMGR